MGKEEKKGTCSFLLSPIIVRFLLSSFEKRRESEVGLELPRRVVNILLRALRAAKEGEQPYL